MDNPFKNIVQNIVSQFSGAAAGGSVIGVDIGCGVQSLRLGDRSSKERKVSGIDSVLPEFDKYLRAQVPAGFSSRAKPSKRREWLYKWWFGQGSDWDGFEEDVENLSARVGSRASKVWCECGSLGGGNHFIEIGRGQEDDLWLTVHSGSRHFGLLVAEFHQKAAVKKLGRKNGLEWLEGEDALGYLRDMRLAQKFATLNRLVMLDVLADFFSVKMKGSDIITSVHNFIGNDNVIRKGAISATLGEQLIIPWNMKDGIVLGTGKGNADWNNSAPHGAGRKMSRGDAKQMIPMAEFKQVMKDSGVWSSCVGQSTLDEAPQAYKDAESVLAHIEDTVEVTNKLKPIYNFKAGGNETG